VTSLTLAEIEKLALAASGRCLCNLAKPQPQQVLAVYWMAAFFARWAIIRHLRDVVAIDQDLEALRKIEARTIAEESFLIWLEPERDRHEQAIRGEEAVLAKLGRAVGNDLVCNAVAEADRLAVGCRIVVEGGSPVPREGT
jgi:hypothetical protein